jgi:hypothetical protein
MTKDVAEWRRPSSFKANCLLPVAIVLLFFAMFYVMSTMDRLAMDNFRFKVHQLRPGTKIEQVRRVFNGRPIAECKNSKELARVISRLKYEYQFQNELHPVNGPVLVYTMGEEQE